MSSNIEHVSGNLLDSDAEALVNTVNTVGVMGKGIALQFRQAFPENYAAYKTACTHGDVRPGMMLTTMTGTLEPPHFIVNFPTKRDWRAKAKLEDIDSGLVALAEEIEAKNIRSVAVPPLGCGNGGLDWNLVRPRIEATFAALPDVRVLLFAPEGAPTADAMPVATKPPSMTPTRAALVGLLNRYAMPGYRVTMLEIQKLVYFLQVSGEPMKLNFVKAKFGPYAETLHHVLQRIEGHYVRGYGDRSRDTYLQILQQAVMEAEHFLSVHPETRARMESVFDLIDGFETPYGLELLATVHWLAKNEHPMISTDADLAVKGVHSWSPRKQGTFSASHIKIAWRRLHEQHWI